MCLCCHGGRVTVDAASPFSAESLHREGLSLMLFGHSSAILEGQAGGSNSGNSSQAGAGEEKLIQAALSPLYIPLLLCTPRAPRGPGPPHGERMWAQVPQAGPSLQIWSLESGSVLVRPQESRGLSGPDPGPGGPCVVTGPPCQGLHIWPSGSNARMKLAGVGNRLPG